MAARHFLARSPMSVSARRLWDWHLAPGALERLTPPWETIRVIRAETPREGSEAELVVRLGPLRRRWVARHTDLEPGRGFRDVQVRGPFARWVHTHRTLEAEGGAVLEDSIDYALPLAPLAQPLAGSSVRRRLERTFAWRHARTAADLDRHLQAVTLPTACIAITGGGGLVGRQLTAFLRGGGHEVVRLVRGTPRDESELGWDPIAGRVDLAGLEGVDAVVHLAGENIAARRWNEAQKARIRDSRVHGTATIAQALANLQRPPRVLVAASAVGYYGDRGDEPLDEQAGPGSGFLAETCRAWERATRPAVEAGVRVVSLRIGIVLAAQGGALARMLLPFRLAAGGRLGSGRQFMSWIALDDLVGVLHRALWDERLEGPVNAVAPVPLTNGEFTRTLGCVLKRPTSLAMPATAVDLALGEMGCELLLSGARVLPRQLERVGFAFRFPDAESALRSELGLFDASFPRPEFRHK